ncbi:putative glycoside hydrolase [Candidatus Poriferisodalis sp.]|uniref:putative glycoside hydrolase n=1 Tax=Candidatus Poriferisodalis sp. TaxID=3101277 RepID=UPI003B016757
MPLLAPADRRILRELLSRGGSAEIGEISAATALDGEAVQTSLATLHQSGIVAPVGSVPGLRGARWSLTQHGHEVGPSLVGNDLAQQHADDAATQAADPAEGWGFPWRPPKPEAPLYATGLSRRARRVADRAVLSTAGPRRQRRRGGRLLLVILLVAATIGVGIVALGAVRVTEITVSGISESAILRPDQVQGTVLEFTVDGGDLASAQLLLDGLPVSGVQRYDNSIVWPVPGLTEGTHVVTLDVDRRFFGTAQAAVAFTVDGTPPEVELPRVFDPVELGEPVVVAGSVEPGVSLRIGDQQVDTASGSFSLTLPSPPGGPVPVIAEDTAGNKTEFNVIVPIGYPHTTGVHVTAAAWDHDGLRESVVELIEQGRINTVQLDLKDEDGRIGHRTDVRLAQLAGASRELYDLREAVDELHGLGVRVIGRIVAFRDPTLARYAAANGSRDWVLQTPDGRPLSSYGGFTNFNHSIVRQYNLDIAAEAAEAGIDDILWDYMRRPEGDLSGIRIPGWDGGDPSQVIVEFLAEAGSMLREAQVFHGVSVFGIAADRGEWVAQDIGAMSEHVDYVAPMVYPSHWGRGEYGVVHPEAQPYDITRASLAQFQRVLAGTNTAVVPWLQDFSMRVNYGPAEVRAQIDAAADLGISDWLLWDPQVTYTNEGIPVSYR